MIMRIFFDVGFATENRIGKAVELETYEIPDCTSEAIEQAHLSGQPFLGFSELTLDEGRRLGALPSGITLSIARRATDNLDFDVVVNGIGWKIVSTRLGDTLKKAAPNDIELLPVAITDLEGKVLREDFCVINVLQMLDIISEKKTVRSRNKKSVFNLAIIGSKVPPDVHVFRVKEWPWALIVDDVAKHALTTQPHDGLVFIPVEQE